MPEITSCATLGYAAFDLETACAAIARLGFRKIEISEMGSYCRHFPFRVANVAAVQKPLSSFRLVPVAMNVSPSRLVNGEIYRPKLSDSAEAEQVIECARWFLQQAKLLGVGLITFPIGPRVLGKGWAGEMKSACRAFRRIVESASELGVKLNLEVPHLYQLTDTVEHVKAVFEEIGDPALGATVDASHWGIIQYDLDAFIDWLGPRLRHVHLRDSAGADTRDFQQDLERTPGKGMVDFAAFGRALDRAGYRGQISLEFEYRHTDRASIDAEFAAGLRHLRSCGFTCAAQPG